MASKSKRLSVAVDLLSNEISGTIRKISLNQISPSKDQPRSNKDINIEKLSKSLSEEGLLQPIVVTKDSDNHFKIIAGERRYRAALHAGWDEIECKILNTNTVDTYRLAVIENLQRENLNPIEESIAYKKLKEMFSYTDFQLSEVIGKSRNYITEILSISEIPEDIQKKALDLGINNRNIFVQLAQAVKNKCENEFLLNFEKGVIATVKDAKTYLKTKKNGNNTNQIPKNILNITPIIHVNIPTTSSNDFKIDISIENLNDLNISIEKLKFLIEKNVPNLITKSIKK